jgi:hypothetical protein
LSVSLDLSHAAGPPPSISSFQETVQLLHDSFSHKTPADLQEEIPLLDNCTVCVSSLLLASLVFFLAPPVNCPHPALSGSGNSYIKCRSQGLPCESEALCKRNSGLPLLCLSGILTLWYLSPKRGDICSRPPERHRFSPQ